MSTADCVFDCSTSSLFVSGATLPSADFLGSTADCVFDCSTGSLFVSGANVVFS